MAVRAVVARVEAARAKAVGAKAVGAKGAGAKGAGVMEKAVEVRAEVVKVAVAMAMAMFRKADDPHHRDCRLSCHGRCRRGRRGRRSCCHFRCYYCLCHRRQRLAATCPFSAGGCCRHWT